MFGWELPPYHSGGLGVACFELTKAMHQIGGTNVTFVIPRHAGSSPLEHMRVLNGRSSSDSLLAGADQVNAPTISKSSYHSDLLDEVAEYRGAVPRVIAQAEQFDVIHAHDWLGLCAGMRAKEISGKPLVAHIHSTEIDRSGTSRNETIFGIEKAAMDLADQIILVSDYTRRHVAQAYDQPIEKLEVVYNSIPDSSFVTKQPRCPSRQLVVSFIGRITWQKGPEKFILAARIVAATNSNVRFVVAGDGDQLASCISLVATLGLSHLFEFPGFLSSDSVSKLLSLSDVFVMPSVSEPFGIVALEAAGANVPLVLSRCSGVSEILKSACMINPEDINGIASSILGLLIDPKKARNQARIASLEAMSTSWVNSATRVLSIYNRLVS